MYLSASETVHQPAARPGRRSTAGVVAGGFTLIELIGALAIVALIVGIAAQSGFERMKQTDRSNEMANAGEIITGIERAVVQTRSLPTATNWVSVVAGQLSKSTNQVAKNRQGNNRVLLFDPAFKIGPSATNTLPFVQSAAGSLLPANARAVLVSSTASPLPSLSSSDFSTLWNTAVGALPSGWSTSWGGKAEDLRIERLDFARLFRRVILNNLDSTAAAPYGIDGTNVVQIPALSRVEGWFVDTSQVNLYFSTQVLQARETLVEDTSYVFENGRWGRSVTYGTASGSTSLGELVDAFIDSPELNNTAQAPAAPVIPTETVTAGTTGGCYSRVTVTFYGCTNFVYVTSTKDLSNVVLEMCDGTRYKYDNLNNPTGTFYSTSGKNIIRVWVKSGCYQSGDGPGYGWKVEGPCTSANCGPTTPTPTTDVRNGCKARDVAEACHKVLKDYADWSNRGCPRGGTNQADLHPSYRAIKDSCASLRDFSRNLCKR